MRYHESRDENIVQPAKEIIFDLPPEVPKEPAAGSDVRVSEEPTVVYDLPEPLVEQEASTPIVRPFFLWVQRTLAVFSILAIVALVFLGAVSAIRIVMDESDARHDVATNARPAAELNVATNSQPAIESDAFTDRQLDTGSDVTTNAQPADQLTQSEEPLNLDSSSVATFAPVSIPRSNIRRKLTRPRKRVASYEPRSSMPRLAQPLQQLFFPTTLVIYIENGVIKTRIEPWLQTTPTPNN